LENDTITTNPGNWSTSQNLHFFVNGFLSYAFFLGPMGPIVQPPINSVTVSQVLLLEESPWNTKYPHTTPKYPLYGTMSAHDALWVLMMLMSNHVAS
jgi:hypothetical protein